MLPAPREQNSAGVARDLLDIAYRHLTVRRSRCVRCRNKLIDLPGDGATEKKVHRALGEQDARGVSSVGQERIRYVAII